MINEKHPETVLLTPRLALDPSCRFRWQITAADRERFDSLKIGEVCEITELEHRTRWIIRRAACSMTEPGTPSCYCDAQALPIEYPGGFDDFPIEDEAPLELQLTSIRQLISSKGLPAAFRLELEQAAKEIEEILEAERIVGRLRAELEETETRLDSRELTATERQQLNNVRAELLSQLRSYFDADQQRNNPDK